MQVGALGGFDGCFAVGAGALSIVGGQGVLGVVSVEVSPTVAIDAATGRARVDVTVAAELSLMPADL
ncbi:MAG: hypothetical protein L0H84_12775 [Pseudonocardia sp.]|nr:hypothetical protein [Pseudonocardia sp.]